MIDVERFAQKGSSSICKPLSSDAGIEHLFTAAKQPRKRGTAILESLSSFLSQSKSPPSSLSSYSSSWKHAVELVQECVTKLKTDSQPGFQSSSAKNAKGVACLALGILHGRLLQQSGKLNPLSSSAPSSSKRSKSTTSSKRKETDGNDSAIHKRRAFAEQLASLVLSEPSEEVVTKSTQFLTGTAMKTKQSNVSDMGQAINALLSIDGACLPLNKPVPYSLENLCFAAGIVQGEMDAEKTHQQHAGKPTDDDVEVSSLEDESEDKTNSDLKAGKKRARTQVTASPVQPSPIETEPVANLVKSLLAPCLNLEMSDTKPTGWGFLHYYGHAQDIYPRDENGQKVKLKEPPIVPEDEGYARKSLRWWGVQQCPLKSLDQNVSSSEEDDEDKEKDKAVVK